MASKRGGTRLDTTRGDAWILLIGVFKLLKGISLVIVAFGLLRLLHRDVGAVVEH